MLLYSVLTTDLLLQLPCDPRMHLRHGRPPHQLRGSDHPSTESSPRNTREASLDIVHPSAAHGRPRLIQRRHIPRPGQNTHLPRAVHGWGRESKEHMRRLFRGSEPLPSAQKLLADLSRASSISHGDKRIELALASSTTTGVYELKMSRFGT